MTQTRSSRSRGWLVTGASRGLGRSLCELLLERGHAVAAGARDPSVLAGLAARYPGHLLALPLDVRDEPSVRAAVEQAESRFGIDVVVNNAGYVVVGAVEEVPVAQAQEAFDTNYFGAIRVIQAALPAMRERRSGHIVNISAMGGMTSSGGLSAYCATKFALEAMTESLAAELAPFAIRVTSIQPGSFRTDAQSSSQTGRLMSEYESSSGALSRRFRSAHGTQPGDPRRAMEVLLQAVESEHPPLRLPVGRDAVQRIRNKLEAVVSELERWEPVSVCDS